MLGKSICVSDAVEPIPRTPVNRGQESKEGPRNAEETGMLPYYCSLPKLDPGDLADWPLQNVQGSFCKRPSGLGRPQ